LLYYLGLGVKQDYVQAAKWLNLAAKQGHATAFETLGRIFFLGHGVDKNNVLAYKWFSLAVHAGANKAQEGLDIIIPKMSTIEIDEAERLNQQWRKEHNTNAGPSVQLPTH